MAHCRLILPDGRQQHTAYRFPSFARDLEDLGLYKLLSSDRRPARCCSAGYWDYAEERDVDWVAGAFMLLPRAGVRGRRAASTSASSCTARTSSGATGSVIAAGGSATTRRPRSGTSTIRAPRSRWGDERVALCLAAARHLSRAHGRSALRLHDLAGRRRRRSGPATTRVRPRSAGPRRGATATCGDESAIVGARSARPRPADDLALPRRSAPRRRRGHRSGRRELLDVGCGEGALAGSLKAAGARRVAGIELDAGRRRRRAEAAGHLVEGDAATVPSPFTRGSSTTSSSRTSSSTCPTRSAVLARHAPLPRHRRPRRRERAEHALLPVLLRLILDRWSYTDAGRTRPHPPADLHAAQPRADACAGTDSSSSAWSGTIACSTTSPRSAASAPWQPDRRAARRAVLFRDLMAYQYIAVARGQCRPQSATG